MRLSDRDFGMGVRNYLIEGVSGTGKTSVCHELLRRGHHSIHGDRELAYQGDPKTGEPCVGFAHEHHIWDIDKVRAFASDDSHATTFFCGGSRNFGAFLDLFDLVFVLEVDRETLSRRLALRSENEWGAQPSEKDFIAKLHASKKDVPTTGVCIDAMRPIVNVVDDILQKCAQASDVRSPLKADHIKRRIPTCERAGFTRKRLRRTRASSSCEGATKPEPTFSRRP